MRVVLLCHYEYYIDMSTNHQKMICFYLLSRLQELRKSTYLREVFRSLVQYLNDQDAQLILIKLNGFSCNSPTCYKFKIEILINSSCTKPHDIYFFVFYIHYLIRSLTVLLTFRWSKALFFPAYLVYIRRQQQTMNWGEIYCIWMCPLIMLLFREAMV